MWLNMLQNVIHLFNIINEKKKKTSPYQISNFQSRRGRNIGLIKLSPLMTKNVCSNVDTYNAYYNVHVYTCIHCTCTLTVEKAKYIVHVYYHD